ncbi:pyrimidine reductase [Lentzea sp. NBRC 105346]|uniref:dihydrofolate reductase family protein n=1 Tax=Lentzea sp. NBRC 105346 TaxID=3032205 RepID=UPI0024A160DC|nr:dihydrofolate reductase family protein [Lentzea sp. NBRC 105346]GLZ33737.1 pyrimidine reductase [Lentzea sp. NBRC 105346]
MRLVAVEYVSLDGVFEEPGQWSHPWFSDEVGQFKWAELQASDALLLGRKTYEGFAEAWPKMRAETGEFGEKFNTMPKYVVSSTLDSADWEGSILLKGDPVEEVRKVREQPGNDLLLNGSAQLFNTLRQANLIDVYRIMLFPVVLGEGRKLFADGFGKQPLKPVEQRNYDSGLTIIDYEPA